MVGIYKITSPSGRIYIGQSWNILRRFNDYKKTKGKKQPTLYNSFKKYNINNHDFKIIHELPVDVTQEILNQYEIFYWNHYKNSGFKIMNIREPGSKGKHSDETKAKMSKAAKGKHTWLKGRSVSKETRLKISKAHKGKIFTEEHKLKIKNGKKIISEETKQKLRKAWEKRIISEETKKKISQALRGNKYRLGKKHSEEIKEKIRNTIKITLSKKLSNKYSET